MPLSQSELEALDPSDPADAAILQEEALAYLASTESLTTDVADLTEEVEMATIEAHQAERRVIQARIATQPRSRGGLRFARGA